MVSTQAIAAPKHENVQKGQHSATTKGKQSNVANELRKQRNLINKGVAKGELTKREVKKLNKEQKRIKTAKHRMQKNGLSKAEVKKLKVMLSKAKHHIVKESNDSERVKLAKRHQSGKHS